ncbi:coiled-coil domain-containing protein 113 [Cylas formicarius]|uniref:coiled-coil domain-containing protein 113 n=1 Tax=Cylas formicarius TaxID=197179 RepID=UPI002958476F|nr:coiled-coil domain-containing protein 113 [Cylas formicarius]
MAPDDEEPSNVPESDVPPREPHPLDELTDQQVIDLVSDLEMENAHLRLENTLFENFLQENDPSLLEDVEDVMKQLSAESPLPKLKVDSYTSLSSIVEGKGPKINLSQKTEMATRAMDDSQSRLQNFLKKTHIIKRNLKSELEEFAIREAEIREAVDIFEFSVVTQGCDRLTHRIPAEKFVRYMEEWLKSAQLQIEKLRLRIATLKVQYRKVSQQLVQKRELGENVHAVDFDQLEIENKNFADTIERKNLHVLELKKINGGANLVLSTHKKYLRRQQEDYHKLREEIADKRKLIEETEKQVSQAEEEVRAARERYEQCRRLRDKYTVPDVMDYVRIKERLHETAKEMKMWTRRRKVQDIALNACLREMKHVQGNVDPSWLAEADTSRDDA